MPTPSREMVVPARRSGPKLYTMRPSTGQFRLPMSAVVMLGVVATQSGEPEKGLELIRRSLTSGSPTPAVLNNLGLALMALEDHGLTPDMAPVLVTGASGGVGSVAVAIIARLGYQVTASTGSAES